MAEFLARLALIPGAFAVWIGQQRERWRTRPRYHPYGWTCGECGMLHFYWVQAQTCDHGATDW